jgi:protein-disulfide isomerase
VITVKIDDPKPAADLPGFNQVFVHLSYNDAHLDQAYYVSSDGQRIFKGEVYDLNKSPFQANLDKIKTDNQPSFGAPEGAPVTLVVFGDFECPYCKEEATTLRQSLPSTFPGKVRVYFMDYPLESIHPWSRAAAIAGRCVLKQGESAFWKYHDWIYDKQSEITADNYNSKLMEWAGQSGVDSVQLGRCVESKATDAEVTRTQNMGNQVGVDGATPTLYLNGRKLVDQNAQWPTLQQIITLEIDHQAKIKEEAEKCCVVEIPKVIK